MKIQEKILSFIEEAERLGFREGWNDVIGISVLMDIAEDMISNEDLQNEIFEFLKSKGDKIMSKEIKK